MPAGDAVAVVPHLSRYRVENGAGVRQVVAFQARVRQRTSLSGRLLAASYDQILCGLTQRLRALRGSSRNSAQRLPQRHA
jgi:hypothetical protein